MEGLGGAVLGQLGPAGVMAAVLWVLWLRYGRQMDRHHQENRTVLDDIRASVAILESQIEKVKELVTAQNGRLVGLETWRTQHDARDSERLTASERAIETLTPLVYQVQGDIRELRAHVRPAPERRAGRTRRARGALTPATAPR